MLRLLLLLQLSLCVWLGVPVQAQDLSVVARIDMSGSYVRDSRDGAEMSLALSQGVPFRVFTVDDPARVIVDFREVSFDGVTPEAMQGDAGRLTNPRFGVFRPGWSRLVLNMTEPMVVETTGMPVDPETGRARFDLKLRKATAEEFAARAEAPQTRLDVYDQAAVPREDDGRFVVVIDPGHGGIDPGATRGDTQEKDLMLEIGLTLRDLLRRTGMVEVVLTRDRDVFVSLKARVALAHQVGADLVLSLHADTVAQGRARGATVYTLSAAASDAASEQLAIQHNRSDLIAGLDLSAADDEITSVLLGLARQETRPRTRALADAIVASLSETGGPMNRHPHRAADFSVLRSADIPSVLVEVGFLSDERDLKNLRDPEWRARMAIGLARGILEWRQQDLADRALVRQ